MTPAPTPQAALAALLAGNQRFVEGEPQHPHQDARRRVDNATRQDPFAVIVGCSDSRVAAEIIFDRGLGDLFVVRTAGHMLDTAVLASVEFAIDALHVPLVLVLGHDNCGAIAAAIAAVDTGAVPDGFQRPLVEHLMPDVLIARAAGITDPDTIARQRAATTAELLLTRSPLIADAVAAHRCDVIAGSYNLAHGRVRTLPTTSLHTERGRQP